MLMNQRMFLPLIIYRGALIEALIIEHDTGSSFIADHLINDFTVMENPKGALCRWTRNEIITKHGGLIDYRKVGINNANCLVRKRD
jgi:hypothetical protein